MIAPLRIKETWVRPRFTGQAKDKPPFVLQVSFETANGSTSRLEHCVFDAEVTPLHWLELGLLVAQRQDAPRVEHVPPISDDQPATTLEDLL